MPKHRSFLLLIFMSTLVSGCAILHHAQMGEIHSVTVLKGRKFEVKVSETGLSVDEASKVAQSLTRNQGTQNQIQKVRDIISMFQMGPRTGNMVFNEKYADEVYKLVLKACPSGNISGLMSVRELRKYPVVSGEIVRISGYCKEGT